jgi:hypothetical protein
MKVSWQDGYSVTGLGAEDPIEKITVEVRA